MPAKATEVRVDEAGFSLAELVIVIVVVSIAAFVFTGMFIQAVKSSRKHATPRSG